MSQIEIRGEFIRIARSFTAGASGVFSKQQSTAPYTGAKGIYVEPHKSGKGVLIVSTDFTGLCIQWDQKGHVDRPRLIMGLGHSQAMEMSGAILDDRWLVGTPEKLTFVTTGKSRPKQLEGVIAQKCRIQDEETDEPGVFPYPNFRHLVPTQGDLDEMEDGYPGYFDMSYAAILGRLHSDGAQNCRTIRVKHGRMGNNAKSLPPGENILVLQFPWRPHMFVVVAPMINVESSMWHDNLLAAIEGEPGHEPQKVETVVKEDPAADL